MKAARLMTIFLAAAVCFAAGDPWDDKSYQEWSQKDVEKILNSSPWAKRLATKVSYVKESRDNKQTDTGAYNTGRETDRGTMRETDFVTVNWWSARTTRRAYLRLAVLGGAEVSEEAANQFANAPMAHYVVTISGGGTMLAVSSRLSEDELKQSAWLELGRERRLDPVAAGVVRDARGQPERIRFHFPREVDGAATIGADEKRVSFKFKLPKDRQKFADAEQREVFFEPQKMVLKGEADF